MTGDMTRQQAEVWLDDTMTDLDPEMRETMIRALTGETDAAAQADDILAAEAEAEERERQRAMLRQFNDDAADALARLRAAIAERQANA